MLTTAHHPSRLHVPPESHSSGLADVVTAGTRRRHRDPFPERSTCLSLFKPHDHSMEWLLLSHTHTPHREGTEGTSRINGLRTITQWSPGSEPTPPVSQYSVPHQLSLVSRFTWCLAPNTPSGASSSGIVLIGPALVGSPTKHSTFGPDTERCPEPSRCM